MKGSFEWKLSDGRVCKLEAEYECVMETEILDADGWKVEGKRKPTEAGRCNLVAYVDGKRVDSCWDTGFWRLIDVRDGVKKIWGLKVAFAKKEDAERYETWITEIIEGGKSDEVKAYEQEQRKKEAEREVAEAKRIIKKAEAQMDIPPQTEARRRMKQYNDIVNEGGEGYVPYIYSKEEYEYAKQIVEKYASIQ